MDNLSKFLTAINALGLTLEQKKGVLHAAHDLTIATIKEAEMILIGGTTPESIPVPDVASFSGIVHTKPAVEQPAPTPPIVDFFAQLGSYFEPKNAA